MPPLRASLPQTVPIKASTLDEDLRSFLVEALPSDRLAAEQDYGFEQINEPPDLATHHYLEGYFHALPGHEYEAVPSPHPYWPADVRLERRPAPLPIAAFCEAFRRRCAGLALDRLTASFAAALPIMQQVQAALERGAHFADVSVQYHWGSRVSTGRAYLSEHTDVAYSLLHLAVGLQSQRTLLAWHRGQSSRSRGREQRLLQRQGAAYLTAPCYFQHAVEYPETTWDTRVIAMQCRILLDPEKIPDDWALDFDEHTFRSVIAFLTTCTLELPSLAEVQAVVAEICKTSLPSSPSTLRASASTTVSLDGSSPEAARARLAEERELVLSIVREDGAALEYEDEGMRADFEIVLAAVLQHGAALKFASEGLKANRGLVLAAVCQDPLAIGYAAMPLQADREFARVAVQLDAQVLQHLNLEFRADPEIVRLAVKQDGDLLRYASDSLKANKEIALAAVEQSGEVLSFLPEELRADPAVVLAAVRQDRQLVLYASGELKDLLDFLAASVEASGHDGCHDVGSAVEAAGAAVTGGTTGAAADAGAAAANPRSSATPRRGRSTFSQLLQMSSPPAMEPDVADIPGRTGETQQSAWGGRSPPSEEQKGDRCSSPETPSTNGGQQHELQQRTGAAGTPGESDEAQLPARGCSPPPSETQKGDRCSSPESPSSSGGQQNELQQSIGGQRNALQQRTGAAGTPGDSDEVQWPARGWSPPPSETQECDRCSSPEMTGQSNLESPLTTGGQQNELQQSIGGQQNELQQSGGAAGAPKEGDEARQPAQGCSSPPSGLQTRPQRSSHEDPLTNAGRQNEPQQSSSVAGIVEGSKVEPPPLGTCYVVGSWDDFRERREMLWDGNLYSINMEFERSWWRVQFQILAGWWEKRIYPSIRDANPSQPHRVFGPDGNVDRAHDRNWAIHPERKTTNRKPSFIIEMSVKRGCPERISWRRIC